jgi:hypothetical protein
VRRSFQYRLERVRRVRGLEERVARSERVRAQELARAAEASRDQAREVLTRSRAWLCALLERGEDPRQTLPSERALAAELGDLRRKLEAARTLRIQAERMAALHQARRSAARALEELRERARRQHAALLERHDNALLDEVAQRTSPPEPELSPARETDRSDVPWSRES